MCLSIPGEIIKIDGETAQVKIGQLVYNSSTRLIENLEIGDQVLVHSGFIIQKLTSDEVEDIKKTLGEILGDDT